MDQLWALRRESIKTWTLFEQINYLYSVLCDNIAKKETIVVKTMHYVVSSNDLHTVY